MKMIENGRICDANLIALLCKERTWARVRAGHTMTPGDERREIKEMFVTTRRSLPSGPHPDHLSLPALRTPAAPATGSPLRRRMNNELNFPPNF